MKLLFFQLKNVCYRSYRYFSDRLAEEMAARGHQVSFFNAEEEPLEQLERLIGESFDAMIDFNSDLPKLEMEEGGYFLDQIHAPFYDVILDHPLYHHDMLKQKLSDFHVLCLDENHVSYIQTHYPHIKTVSMLPMTGDPAGSSHTGKDIPLLFSGSYTDPLEVEAAIGNTPAFLKKDTFSLIDMMKADPSLTLEQAVTLLKGDTLPPDLFPLHMQAYFLADTYLRAFYRHEILNCCIESGLPVTIIGNGFEKASFYKKNNSVFPGETDFKNTFSLMGRAVICLNIMPGFKAGVHDRIFSSMLNGSVSLTDSSSWIDAHLHPGKDLLTFSLKDYKTDLTEKLPDWLSQKDSLLQEIAAEGEKEARKYHTWQMRAKELERLLLLDNFPGVFHTDLV